MNKDVVETAVEVMGRTIHVKCPQSEILALQQAAKYLEDKLRTTREASQTLSFERAAVITALNITHELLAAEQEKNEYSQFVNRKLRDLKSRVDEALITYTQMELEPAKEV